MMKLLKLLLAIFILGITQGVQSASSASLFEDAGVRCSSVISSVQSSRPVSEPSATCELSFENSFEINTFFCNEIQNSYDCFPSNKYKLNDFLSSKEGRFFEMEDCIKAYNTEIESAIDCFLNKFKIAGSFQRIINLSDKINFRELFQHICEIDPVFFSVKKDKKHKNTNFSGFHIDPLCLFHSRDSRFKDAIKGESIDTYALGDKDKITQITINSIDPLIKNISTVKTFFPYSMSSNIYVFIYTLSQILYNFLYKMDLETKKYNQDINDSGDKDQFVKNKKYMNNLIDNNIEVYTLVARRYIYFLLKNINIVIDGNPYIKLHLALICETNNEKDKLRFVAMYPAKDSDTVKSLFGSSRSRNAVSRKSSSSTTPLSMGGRKSSSVSLGNITPFDFSILQKKYSSDNDEIKKRALKIVTQYDGLIDKEALLRASHKEKIQLCEKKIKEISNTKSEGINLLNDAKSIALKMIRKEKIKLLTDGRTEMRSEFDIKLKEISDKKNELLNFIFENIKIDLNESDKRELTRANSSGAISAEMLVSFISSPMLNKDKDGHKEQQDLIMLESEQQSAEKITTDNAHIIEDSKANIGPSTVFKATEKKAITMNEEVIVDEVSEELLIVVDSENKNKIKKIISDDDIVENVNKYDGILSSPI